MAKYTYPAIFSVDDEDKKAYTVVFPDLLGCVTEGHSLEEAIYMAKDALAGYLLTSEEDGDEIPAASISSNFTISSDSFILDIEVNTTDFFK